MVRGHKGFSLFELLITLAVFGIIVGIAVPSVTSFRDKRKIISVAEAVYSQLQLARSEAVARSQQTYVKVDSNADGTVWGIGLSTNNNCDVTQSDGSVEDCYLIMDNGDGTQVEVYNSFFSSDYPGVMLGAYDVGTDEFNGLEVSFDPTRGTATGNTVTIKLRDIYEMKVITFATGRVRICSPSGTLHVGGYSSDSCS